MLFLIRIICINEYVVLIKKNEFIIGFVIFKFKVIWIIVIIICVLILYFKIWNSVGFWMVYVMKI